MTGSASKTGRRRPRFRSDVGVTMGKTDTAMDARADYLAAFAGFEKSLNGGASTALHARRRAAIAVVGEGGLPTARDEAWRHTNPAPLTRTCFTPVAAPGSLSAADIAPFVAAAVDGPLLVFADGHFNAGLSRLDEIPEGLLIHSLASGTPDAGAPGEHLARHADAGERTFAALNTAFVHDGAVVEIKPGAIVETPVQILYVSTGTQNEALTTPRTLVVAGDHSQASVVETFATTAPQVSGLTAPVTEIVVGADAILEHTRLHLHGEAGYHAGTVHVSEARGARFTAHTFCLTGLVVREDVTTVLDGEGVESTLNGLFLPRGEEQVDNYTTIEHAAPNSSSHELYKGVLGGAARGVFRGKIHVHQVAQKTDAFQSNQNLLVSEDAEIVSKPQLEIYADDVKCSHGSTTGQLDPAALFYLRARGIGLQAARRVLTRAFADELVDRVGHEGLRQHVAGIVSARLDAVLAAETTS